MTTLFHATPVASLDGILTHGLDPAKSQSSLKAVFFTDDEHTAANYACMRDNEHVMLAVELEALDAALLGPDNYELPDLLRDLSAANLKKLGYGADVEWAEVSWSDSLRISNQVAYYGVVPPSAIKVVESRFLISDSPLGR